MQRCIDSRVLYLELGTLCLDEKVAELFEQLRDPIFRYLVAVFGNPGEAEEITQEAFYRFYRCLRGGQAVSDVRSWLFRVAHNLAVDQQKGKKYLAVFDVTLWEELCELHQDPTPNPEQRVLQREHAERLQSLLAHLSSQQRECLVLRAEGFRYREIAEFLGVSISTVEEFVRRGIKKMMKEIHE